MRAGIRFTLLRPSCYCPKMNISKQKSIYPIVVCVLLFWASFTPALAQTSSEFFTDRDVFPIGFWWGPPESRSDEPGVWERVAEAGFTLCAGRPFYSRAANMAMVRHCGRLQIPSIVMDSEVDPSLVTRDGWESTLDRAVTEYSSANGRFGFLLKDEPHGEEFQRLRTLQEKLRSRANPVPSLINLFPTYATPAQLGFSRYVDYVRGFLAEVDPTAFLYDFYPFLADDRDRVDFFSNLEIVREAAMHAQSEFGLYIQSWAFRGLRAVSEGELRWQVNSALAYGARALLYFTFWPDETWGSRNAIVDDLGVPTTLFPIVRQVNAETAAIGGVLRNLRSTRIYHTGTIPPGTRRQTADELISVEGDSDVLVGIFASSDESIRYALVVNRSYGSDVTVPLQLRADVGQIFRFDPVSGNEVNWPMIQNRTSVVLAPGASALFRLPYPQG